MPVSPSVPPLRGRTALVTGASSGIGAACARALSATGASLVLTARDVQRLDSVASALDAPADVIPCDLSAPGGADRLAAAVLARTGGVDVLVNCAGYGPIQRTQRVEEAELTELFRVNVIAPLILCGRLVDAMIELGGGTIINVSSVTGSLGTTFQAGYAATKAALDGMTRSMAREFGKRRIRVNAIAPGLIRRPSPPGSPAAQMYDGAADYIALPDLADYDAVADVVVFLASDASRYMTGQVVYVDGGTTHTGDIVRPEAFTHR